MTQRHWSAKLAIWFCKFIGAIVFNVVFFALIGMGWNWYSSGPVDPSYREKTINRQMHRDSEGWYDREPDYTPGRP